MENKDYWFSVLIQDGETLSEIEEVKARYENDEKFNLCQFLVDCICGVGFEDNADNFTDYEPYIGRGDVLVDEWKEFKLMYNNSVFGCYMLMRKAYEDEVLLGKVKKG